MADKTQIEWTDATWNPVTGCTKVSPGCAHCYAESVDHRFDHDKVGKLSWAIPASQGGRGVTMHPERLGQPLKWRKPRKIFVNSMSDLFHEDVPDEFIDRVFAVMALTTQHTYQILTKRPERMLEYMTTLDVLRPSKIQMAAAQASQWREGPLGYPMTEIDWPGWPLPNVWLGVSVENQHWADRRIAPLLETPAAVRFVSYEPALKPVDFTPWLTCQQCGGLGGYQILDRHEPGFARLCSLCRGRGKRLHQIIIGAESGPRARPCEWPLEAEIEQRLPFGRTPLMGGIEQAIRSTLDQARPARVAVFVKQMGSVWAIHHAHGWECGEYYTHYSVSETYRPDRKGGDMEHWPEDLRVREYPAIVEAVTA